jgi:hypothetical protein
MFTKTVAVVHAVLAFLLSSAALFSQTMPAPTDSSAGLEFPVVMRQNVAAGATPVGTRVEAKLAVATLVNGVVVPQDAILSGEVTESVAKSATGPSRLGIRIDSAQWKNGARPKVLQLTTKVYLTAWYYPVVMPSPQDISDDPMNTAPTPRRRNGSPSDSAPPYPTPNLSAAEPFPGHDPSRKVDTFPAPPASESSISQHRVLMRDVESTRNSEGVVTLTSKRSNIKLDKTTTYVFAAGNLATGQVRAGTARSEPAVLKLGIFGNLSGPRLTV